MSEIERKRRELIENRYSDLLRILVVTKQKGASVKISPGRYIRYIEAGGYIIMHSENSSFYTTNSRVSQEGILIQDERGFTHAKLTVECRKSLEEPDGDYFWIDDGDFVSEVIDLSPILNWLDQLEKADKQKEDEKLSIHEKKVEEKIAGKSRDYYPIRNLIRKRKQ